MIYQLFPKLKDYTIILGSSSPRRQELLKLTGAKFEVQPSNFEEDLDKRIHNAVSYCTETAKLKTEDVFNQIKDKIEHPLLVIGCDTVISDNGHIIEKPKNTEQAIKILNSLKGREHSVLSSLHFIVRSSNGSQVKCFSKLQETHVLFDDISEEAIKTYVATGDPLDKAGAYGIQGPAALFIKSINGDYYSVMGFPLNSFYQLLDELFINNK